MRPLPPHETVPGRLQVTRISVTSRSAHTADPEILSWDSEFWGRRIGRAHSADINKWAAENMVGTVCLLIPSDQPDRVQDAEQRGFQFMDIRLMLERPTGPHASSVRAYRPADLETLVMIARSAHRITRFYADPGFSADRCDDLYEAWIRNSAAGWADKILVSGDVAHPSGYCTIHIKDGVGSIGLIAVAELDRGKGLGGELTLGAVDWCHAHGVPHITVVTQGRNVPAQRVFQRCGFLTVSNEIWLHKKFSHD